MAFGRLRQASSMSPAGGIPMLLSVSSGTSRVTTSVLRTHAASTATNECLSIGVELYPRIWSAPLGVDRFRLRV